MLDKVFRQGGAYLNDIGTGVVTKVGSLPNYGREVTRMTNFEIFMVVLGVVDTLTALGSFVVALLSFLRKRKTKQK